MFELAGSAQGPSQAEMPCRNCFDWMCLRYSGVQRATSLLRLPNDVRQACSLDQILEFQLGVAGRLRLSNM